MKELLIETLKKIGYPVYLQGSIGVDEKYPDSFFTFWNDSTESLYYYDNLEHAIKWGFSINFYSVDPTLVNKKILEAKKLLIKEQFIVSGIGYDVASDEITHTGRGIDVLYIQKVDNN